MSMFLLGFAASWAAVGLIHTRFHSRNNAANRRIGWHYGYGAGWVDHKHGLYQPESCPEDGQTRPGAIHPENRRPA